MNIPLARGNSRIAKVSAASGHTVIDIHPGQWVFGSKAKISGARMWPVSKMVSQAGPSSARIYHTAQDRSGD